MITSKLCTFSDYEEGGYRDALVDLKEGFTLHRKQWEFAMILRVFKERGFLSNGKSGLGFAVGTEPLPSAFCMHGATILATDQEQSEQSIDAWGDGQLCLGLDKLNSRGLCEPARFEQYCRFRHVDMNHLPDDLGDFDFIWSACAFEHLGSLENGLDFVVNSSRHLKPAGCAVHTTEFNLSFEDKTLSTGGSVYYRRKDIEELAQRLTAEGCRLTPANYDRGNHPVDALIDVVRSPNPPFMHLKLQVDEYTLTSIILVIEKVSA